MWSRHQLPVICMTHSPSSPGLRHWHGDNHISQSASEWIFTNLKLKPNDMKRQQYVISRESCLFIYWCIYLFIYLFLLLLFFFFLGGGCAPYHIIWYNGVLISLKTSNVTFRYELRKCGSILHYAVDISRLFAPVCSQMIPCSSSRRWGAHEWQGNAFYVGDRHVDSPHKGPVTRGFNVFFDVSRNKLSNKQSNCRWSDAMTLMFRQFIEGRFIFMF